MKLRLVIVTFLILALAVPAQMLAQSSKAEQEVRAALDELTQANLKGGAEAAAIFDKNLADDFTVINGTGAVFTKAEVVNASRTGKQHAAEAYDVSDVKIRIYGHTAVATGVLKYKTAGPQPLSGSNTLRSGQARFTRVFVKRDGSWKNVLFQLTPIAAAQ